MGPFCLVSRGGGTPHTHTQNTPPTEPTETQPHTGTLETHTHTEDTRTFTHTHTHTTDLRRHTFLMVPSLPARNPTEFQHLKGLWAGCLKGINPLSPQSSGTVGGKTSLPLLHALTSLSHGSPQLVLAGPSVPRTQAPCLLSASGPAPSVGVWPASPPCGLEEQAARAGAGEGLGEEL